MIISKGFNLLKELFIKIQTDCKTYSKNELNEIEKFLKEEIVIKKEDETYELNSKYKIALVKIGKNLVILEDLVSEHKNIKIEFDDLNGAYDGDLVLAKRVFNPRSRTKAKIVKILDGKKNEVLVYIKDKAFYTVKENIKLENKNALKYQDGDVLLVDEYGHHPTEVLATIKAARQSYPDRRLVMIFQPHRFTRTRDCFDDFVDVLSQVDVLMLLDVYSAGEAVIEGADSRSLARTIRTRGQVEPIMLNINDMDQIRQVLGSMLKGNDLLITQGAGNVGQLCLDLAKNNLFLADK